MKTIALLLVLCACGGSASSDAQGCASLFSNWREVEFTPAVTGALAVTPLLLASGRYGAGQALSIGACTYAADIEQDAGDPSAGTVTLSGASPASQECVANEVTSHYHLLCDALFVLNQYGSATYTTP